MSELQTDGFTRLHVEAALCIWEDMLAAYTEHGRSDNAKPMDDGQHAIFASAWENHGSVEMRHAAINLGAPACATWDAIPQDDQELFAPYDWEFIPWFVNQVEWVPGHPISVEDNGRPFKVPDDIKHRLADETIVRRGREAVLRGAK